MTKYSDYQTFYVNNDIKFKPLLRQQVVPQESSEGILKITVKDTGRGIESKDFEPIFKKFHTKSNNEIGSGLGLYITKQIVNALQGQIRVFSKVQTGSAFVVAIPTNQLVDSIIGSIGSPRTSEKIKRALVVDDESTNRLVLVNFLKRLGVNEIESVEDGTEALKSFEKGFRDGKPFNLITMDYNMPGIDGEETLVKIRNLEKSMGLSLSIAVVVSGHCNKEIIDKLMDARNEAKIHEYVKKPVSFDQMKKILSKYYGIG